MRDEKVLRSISVGTIMWTEPGQTLRWVTLGQRMNKSSQSATDHAGLVRINIIESVCRSPSGSALQTSKGRLGERNVRCSRAGSNGVNRNGGR